MSDTEMAIEKKKKKKDKKRESVESVATVKAATVDIDADDDNDTAADRSTAGISVIAHPLANPKLTKKCLKLVKKASKVKQIRRGVKEVVKAIRKGEKGVMILAGNISPIDVITHLPVLCEENDIPYVFVPAKEDLGSAGSTKRPTSCVLVQCKTTSDHEDYFEQVKLAVSQLPRKS